jgi:hypothetical protein
MDDTNVIMELSPQITKKRVSFAELPTVYSGASPVHPSVRISLKRSDTKTDLKKSRIFSVLFMGLFLTLTAYLLYAGFVEKPSKEITFFRFLSFIIIVLQMIVTISVFMLYISYRTKGRWLWWLLFGLYVVFALYWVVWFIYFESTGEDQEGAAKHVKTVGVVYILLVTLFLFGYMCFAKQGRECGLPLLLFAN